MISEGNAKYIGMNILNDTFKTGLSSKNVKVGCKPLEQHLAILSVYTFFFKYSGSGDEIYVFVYFHKKKQIPVKSNVFKIFRYLLSWLDSFLIFSDGIICLSYSFVCFSVIQ